MMKKMTTILLSFAYIMLLAHAVVPHHHHKHQTSICVLDTHFCSEHDIDPKDENKNTHNESERDYDDCLLSNTVVSENQQNIIPPIFDFIVILYNIDIEILYSYLGKATFPYTPYLESDYTCTFSCIQGLRAPPVRLS